MKAMVDPERCNGCGLCQIICPEVFRMSERGGKPFAVVHSENVPPEAENFCRDAVDCCKPGAVLLAEDSSPRRGRRCGRTVAPAC